MKQASSFTKKTSKVVVASSLGIALLVRGGTYALWSANADANTAATITAGDLQVTSASVQKWTDITKADAPVELDSLADFLLVPGDKLQLKQDLNVVIVGDNITGKLKVLVPNNTESAALMAQAKFTLTLFNKDGVELSSVTPATNSLNSIELEAADLPQTSPTGEAYHVQLTVELPESADNDTKLQVATLANTVVTLEQGAKTAGSSEAPYPPANAESDFTFTELYGVLSVSGYVGSSTDVVIPEKATYKGTEYAVSKIAANAFDSENLTSIRIPDSVNEIGAKAFFDNELTSVVIPDSVTRIGYSAFEGNLLESVELSPNVTSYGSDVFKNNQVTSVELPGSIKDIPSGMFTGNKLTSLVIPEGIKTVGYHAFSSNQITSVKMADTVTAIYAYAFSANSVESVDMSSNLTIIADGAFSGSKLTSVEIPDGVLEIGPEAFKNNKLTEVTIPASVTKIGIQSFYNNQLKSVYMEGNAPLISPYSYYYSDNGSFGDAAGVTVYAHADATGYRAIPGTWSGYQTALY